MKYGFGPRVGFKKMRRALPPNPVFETPNPGGAVVSGNAVTASVPIPDVVAGGTAYGAGAYGSGVYGGGSLPVQVVVGGNAPTEVFTVVVAPRLQPTFFYAWGPARFRRRKKFVIPEVTQETPNPGGVIVNGVEPVANIPATVGGATVGGNVPQAQTTHSPGGALVGGPNPSGAASGVPGGSVEGGNGGTAAVGFNPGGVIAGGPSPSEVIAAEVMFTPKNTLMYLFKVFPRARARLLKKPLGTTADQVDHETPNPGGAIVSGNTITVQVPAVVGGATANGNNPTAALSVSTGGLIAGGFAGTVTTTCTTGGTSVTGNAVVTSTPLTISGVTVGGNQPIVFIAALPRKEPTWFFVWGLKRGFKKLPTRSPKAALVTPPTRGDSRDAVGTVTRRRAARGVVRVLTKGEYERVR